MADFLKVTSDGAFKPTHSTFFKIRIKRFLTAIQSKASNTCAITFERVSLCAAEAKKLDELPPGWEVEQPR